MPRTTYLISADCHLQMSVASTMFIAIHFFPIPRKANCFCRHYEGQLTAISEPDIETKMETPPLRVIEAAKQVSLQEEKFGLTLGLLRFWRKHIFSPFYIGQTPNAIAGEHTSMVLT